MTLIREEKPSKPSHEDKVKAMRWCLKNGIKIWFETISWREGNIVVSKPGEPLWVSEEFYVQNKFKLKDVRYWNVVYDLYYKIYKEESNE